MSNSASKRQQRGLTLVELMVALAIGLIVAAVIFITQIYLFRQNLSSSNELASNNEARSALDLISRDVSSAGFLLGGFQNTCSLTMAYDSGGVSTSGYLNLYPIWSQKAVYGASLPALNAPTISYPPSGSTITSDVLVMTAATDASQFTNTASPQLYLVQFGTTQSSSGQGAINSTQLPVNTLQLNSTQGINPGDTALLQVPMNGQLVCIRIPIINIGPGTGGGATYINSKPSSIMPSNGYSDFSTQLATLGYGNLTNPLLLQSRLLDTGPANSTNEQTIFYYIDHSTYAWPTLMRAVVNAATDTITSTTPVAAGVADLQVLYGVGSAGGNSVTQYLRWSQVVSGNLTGQVRTAQIALVVRTLHADTAYHAPAQITIPSPSLGPGTFAPYPVQASESQDHFAVYTTEIPIRNMLWQR